MTCGYSLLQHQGSHSWLQTSRHPHLHRMTWNVNNVKTYAQFNKSMMEMCYQGLLPQHQWPPRSESFQPWTKSTTQDTCHKTKDKTFWSYNSSPRKSTNFKKKRGKNRGERTKKVKIIYLNSLSTQSLSSCFLSPWMHIASYLRRRLLLVKFLNLILQLGNLWLSATSSLVHE